MRNGASTISVRIRWNCSGGNSSIGATCWMPAQLTTMSAASSSPRTAAVSVRSATIRLPAEPRRLRRRPARPGPAARPGRRPRPAARRTRPRSPTPPRSPARSVPSSSGHAAPILGVRVGGPGRGMAGWARAGDWMHGGRGRSGRGPRSTSGGGRPTRRRRWPGCCRRARSGSPTSAPAPASSPARCWRPVSRWWRSSRTRPCWRCCGGEHPAAVPYLAGADALPIPDAQRGRGAGRAGLALVPARARRSPRCAGCCARAAGSAWSGTARTRATSGSTTWPGWTRTPPAGTSLAAPADDPFEVDGLPADQLEWASFPWLREIDGPSLRGRLLTHSAFAVLDPAERDRLVDAMVAVLDAEAERRGTPTVLLRQSAHCARWRPALAEVGDLAVVDLEVPGGPARRRACAGRG